MTSRFEADGPEMTILSMALVAVLAAASFSLSFLGLLQAAAWAGIPEGLRWLVPVVVDSTILVYAVAATVQRARGENTLLSWLAVGFFTTVSVAANATHVIAPGGIVQPLSPAVAFGALLAGIMPVSLFFATHTTVQLAVAPVHGSVTQRRRRAAKRLVQNNGLDHSGGPLGPKNGPRSDQRTGPGGPLNGPGVDHPFGPPLDHPGNGRRARVKADPEKVIDLSVQGKSQRAIAQTLGVSKTAVARILADHEHANA
jgi:hypothetical protein